jgi:hypothetical protein
VMVMACPICGTVPATMDASLGSTLVHCPRCGPWVLGAIAPQLGISLLNGKLGDWDRPSTHRRSRLSHLIRRQQPASGGAVQIPLDKLETWRLEDPLPSPSEQLDQLVLLVGDHQPSAVQPAVLPLDFVSAWIGTGSRGNHRTLCLPGWLISPQRNS